MATYFAGPYHLPAQCPRPSSVTSQSTVFLWIKWDANLHKITEESKRIHKGEEKYLIRQMSSIK